MSEKEVVLVKGIHIQPGIKKYQGVRDSMLEAHVVRSGKTDFEVYRFEDSRILLVYPFKTHAFLYASEDSFTRLIDLESHTWGLALIKFSPNRLHKKCKTTSYMKR